MTARVRVAMTTILFLLAIVPALLLSGGLGATSAPEGCPELAVIGRERVSTHELTAFWFARHRNEWLRTVDALLDEKLVDHEIRRLGLALPPGTLETAVDEEVKERRQQLKDTYGDEANLGQEVQRAYGVDLATWTRTIIAPRVRMQLLLQRVVRLDTRRRERVKVRVIVCEDEAKARRVLTRLKRGADFSLTALKESTDPTAQGGGDLPAIARGDLVIPGVEDRLFQAREGELVGPIPVVLEGRSAWHIYKVIRQIRPWSGSRQKMLSDLERDLETYPLDRPEFERWRGRMRRDFGVRVFDPKGRALTMPSDG